MFDWLLRLIPPPWRESVERDLIEEAADRGRRGLARDAWIAWHLLRVACRFGQRRWTAPVARQPRRSVMRTLGSDVRAATRMLVRQPVSAAAIVVTLGMGIGIVTSVYAVFNHVLFRPVPGVRDDGRLVTMLFHPPGKPDNLGAGALAALPFLRRASTLADVAAGSETQLPVVAAPNAEPGVRHVSFVTSRYFDVLGIRVTQGRLLTDGETDGASPHALVSDSYATRELSSAMSAVGATIIVNGHAVKVVGVVDRFRGWGASRVGRIDVWLPMGIEHIVRRAAAPDTSIEDLVARLHPGVSIAAANAEAGSIYAGLADSLDKFTRQFVPVLYPGLYTFGQDRTHAYIMRTFPFLMGGAGLLLLVACANTANLLLARTRRRTRDLALQAALGARRMRLMRSLLVEATILAAAAAVVGLAISLLITTGLRGLQVFASVPEVVDLAIDTRVAAFAMLVTAATVLLFGLLPAVRASRADVRALLSSPSLATPRSPRVRMALVASQLAISLTLLGAAGVLLRSLTNLRTQDVGMRTHDVVSFSVNPRQIGYNAARRDQLVRDVIGRLASTPGIEAVAFASPPAFWGSGRTSRLIRLDAAVERPEVEVETMTVSGSYFGVLGIPLVEGRTFRPDEFQRPTQTSGGVAIVSASLARALFGSGPAVGRRVVRGTWSMPVAAVMSLDATKGPFVAERELEVVGVASDTRTGWTLRRGAAALLFEPGGQQTVYASFYLRSTRPTAESASLARGVVRELEPGLPVTSLGTVQDEIERLIPEERLFARVMSMVALLAMLLGIAGTYAVMMYTVAERTREFGIRTALGAPPAAIARGVLARALLMCAIGGVAGLGLFAAASRILASRLYGVAALDPLSLLAASAVLSAATVVAAWLPARRATRADPVLVLRSE
jgi:predicted permease